MKKIGLILIASSFGMLVSCNQAPSKPDAPQSETAQLIQPADNQQYYYAIGSGMNTEKAKNDGLSQIAAKISVKVQSNLNTNLTVTKVNNAENIASTYSKDVQAQSKAIEFVGVEVLDTQKLSKVETLALVRVDRNRLFQHYQNKFNQQESELLNTYKVNQQQTLFERLKGEARIQQQMVETQSTLSLLQTINPSYNVASHQKKYQNINNTLKKQRANAVFYVEADKNSKKLKSLIKDKLSDDGFKLTSAVAKANVRLSIKTQAEQKKYRSTDSRFANLKVALRSTTFVVKSGSQIVSNNMVKTKGVASDTYQNAVQSTKAYNKLIQQQGVIGFIAGG